MKIDVIKEKVLAGHEISREEALFLVNANIEELSDAADEIRRHYNGNSFDMCSIISVKGGRCSENCKFCAQSSCSKAEIPSFSVLNTEVVLKDAKAHDIDGITHYCQVSSGRRLKGEELEQVCKNVKAITENTSLVPCVSLGLLEKEDLVKLKAAGVKRIHNNMESSPEFFKNLCTTHTVEQKIEVMKLIHEMGFELCSGGVFGVGESWEDRIDMALALREVQPESVPINMLKPIKGTPMEEQHILSDQEIRRIIAIFKFILPKSDIRFAAGRDVVEDGGMSCFKSGANATISGDMLTVKGIAIKEDLTNIKNLGYRLG